MSDESPFCVSSLPLNLIARRKYVSGGRGIKTYYININNNINVSVRMQMCLLVHPVCFTRGLCTAGEASVLSVSF